MKGSIKLSLAHNQFFQVFGGPYRAKPDFMTGVKMAEEINAPCSVDIPTRDFQVPNKTLMTNGLRLALAHIISGQPVYAGCMGGIGRTGLFLAILAKAWGEENPVGFVRENYLGHAVETQEQQNYVRDFVIPDDVKSLIKKVKFKSWFRPWGEKSRTQKGHAQVK